MYVSRGRRCRRSRRISTPNFLPDWYFINYREKYGRTALASPTASAKEPTWTACWRTSLVHLEHTTKRLTSVKTLDSSGSFIFRTHIDKSEPLRLARRTVCHDAN